jgi:hypothetical protein
MTDQVCPTYASSTKENCNKCLMSDCKDCLDACYDTDSCQDSFSFYKEIQIGNTMATHQVSSNDNITGYGNYPSGLEGATTGEKYVCDINNVGVPKGIKIGSDPLTTFQPIDMSEHSTDAFKLSVSGLHRRDDSMSGFYVNGTHNDLAPTIPTGEDVTVKGLFTGQKASKSFEYIQDLYSETFKKYKELYDQQPGVPPLEVDLHLLRNLDEDTLGVNLFNLVKNLYNTSTFESTNLQFDKKAVNTELSFLVEKINDKKAIIQDLKELNHTNKRNIEINMNKSRKVRNTNRVLLIIMLVVGVLILFPLLSAAKAISKKTSITIWCVALLLVLVYMAYELYYKDINRDESDYKKFIFAKPTDKEIAMSRALAQISDKDKARCQAFSELEEELDAPKINLDVSNYYSRTDPVRQCSHLDE